MLAATTMLRTATKLRKKELAKPCSALLVRFKSSDGHAADGIDSESYGEYGALQVTSPAPNVLQIDLHRPDVLNAFNEELWHNTRDCLRQVV